MINIQLTPEQAKELKKYYEAELKKIEAHAQEINELINKLDIGASPTTKNFETPEINKITTPTVDATDDVAPKKQVTATQVSETSVNQAKKDKNMDKLNWYSFVIQVLQEKNKPLGSNDILKLYEKHSGEKISDMKYARNKLGQVLYRLRHTNKRIRTIKQKGKKETLYALTEWPVADIKQEKEPLVINEIEIAKKTLSAIDNKTTTKSVSKPRGQYNWPKFIIETLNKTKRVLTAREFLKHAMLYYEVPKHEQERTRGKLAPALSRLEKVTKTLKTVTKKGQRSRYFGLSEWFDERGVLIAIYK